MNPRYTATTEHPGSAEHIVDDRAWSDMTSSERTDFLLDEELADAAWADPDWPVDSTTRPCCGGIGDHTQECDAPADARTITPRDEDGRRHFTGTRRHLTTVSVTLAGTQNTDGAVSRHAVIYAPDAELDPGQLRQLAAALLDAADELDTLAPIAYQLT